MKRRRTAAGLLTGFFVVMFLCTLISKGIYGAGLPRVAAQAPCRRTIGHEVKAEGTVAPGEELAINVPEGIRVSQVAVQPGDEVGPETLLFVADQEDLGELIREKEVEIEKLRLNIEDMEKNQNLARQKKGLEQQRAVQDAGRESQKENVSVNRSRQDLKKAEEELAAHLADRPEITGQEDRDGQNRDYENRAREEKELQEQIIELTGRIAQLEPEGAGGSDSGGGSVSGNQRPEEAEEAEELRKTRRDLAVLNERLSRLRLDQTEKPDFAGEDGEWKSWEEKRRLLEDGVQEAKRRLEDALRQQEEGSIDGERAKEDAALPDQADSTLLQSCLTLELLEERLEQYRRIYEAGGEVYGELPGIVTEIRIYPGERTADGGAVRYASQNSPFRLKATLTKDQKKYVNPGDQAEVRLNGTKLTLDVTYLAENRTVPDTFDLEIGLPAQTGVLGMSGSLHVAAQSDSYECCVPIEAVHEESGRFYVYALGSRQTILGEELSAEKIPVTVLDKNERYAALETGVITEETEVIVRSDREMKEGAIVRRME